MRRLLAFLMILIAGSAVAQTPDEPVAGPDVTVRAYLEPDKEIYVGQLVRLWVEITTSTWFSKAPRYPEFQLNGAIALMPEQLGVNFTDPDGGSTRTGQRQRYAIIPQREGTLEIPSLAITVSVSTEGKPSDPVTLQTKPLSMTAAMPPGAQGLEQVVTTRSLTVEETYDRDFSGLKVGDAITRTVTLVGEDTFALALPATKFPAVPGGRAYSAQPVLEDTVNRGQYRAKRTDAVTYVLEQDGSTKMPEIAVRWWNPESSKIEETILPAVEISVAANPDYRPATGLSDVPDSAAQRFKTAVAGALSWLRSNIVWLTLAVIFLYTLVLAIRRFGPPVTAKYKHWREQSLQSEAHYFRAFRHACRSGDTDAVFSSFWKWLDRLSPADRAASLEQITTTSGEAAFRDFASRVSSARYGAGTGEQPSSSDILKQVNRLRRQMKNRRPTTHADRDTLNPRFSESVREVQER
ncbi:MAG: BatD family protein [Hyphomicrobiaceae bacterium]|nr:BatD family protein [Hyphomicrobiaceae bacterium]